MASNNRERLLPKTTKLMPLDIQMPLVQTTLPSGLVVTFKDLEQIDLDAIERHISTYRTVCYGTNLEVWGFACILNEVLVSPLSTEEVRKNREALHNLFIPILDSIDDQKWGSKMITRPYDELEHENSIFAMFWRCWGIAVRSAISEGLIDNRVRLNRMSELLIEYVGSPEVQYKQPRSPEGELIALPIWVRNWFHHTENELEPHPPSRHEIRRAAEELIKLSYALEMSEQERRQETYREEIGTFIRIQYKWLNMDIFLNEERNMFTVAQLNVFSGWSIEVPYSEYLNSGEELVDFALKLKQKATSSP